MSQFEIKAANDQIAKSLIRNQYGPVYVPSLQTDYFGSIREMIDNSGNIVAQYAYTPDGNSIKLQGDMDSDFQYAGYISNSEADLI